MDAEDEADDGIEQHHRGDDDRGFPLPSHDQADHGSDQQDHDHQILELAQENTPPRIMRGLSEPVRTIAMQPPCRLRPGQPDMSVHIKATCRLTGRKSMPRR
jgi:hypothetical protein